MDIAHFSLSSARDNNNSNNNNVSFRSVIIIMTYAATIILSLSAGSMDERLYLSASNVTVWEEELVSEHTGINGALMMYISPSVSVFFLLFFIRKRTKY